MKNDIIKDSYYMINLFENDNKEITPGQLQKLMYFVEAYYMNANNEKMYDCNFNAWALGPVAIPLYKHYKKFGGESIVLSNEEKSEADDIPPENKQAIEKVYNAFKDLRFLQLVNLTHMKNSPWDRTWKKNRGKIGSGEENYINKEETKKWFKEKFITNG